MASLRDEPRLPRLARNGQLEPVAGLQRHWFSVGRAAGLRKASNPCNSILGCGLSPA